MPRRPIGCGWPTRPISRRGLGFCIWRWSWTCTRARSWVGRWGNPLNTELMLAALDMAISQRRSRGVIHHSARACQYTSYAFGKRCTEAGIRPSMGRVGDAYDNAMAESFFATLEREVIDRQRFHSQIDARRAVFSWLESWYNPYRRHSSLGYRSPMNYERHAPSRLAA